MEPLLSIDCTTYNHEKFIRNALDGFLMQKTTFPFEIIIHDDASSDQTVEIIKEYFSLYPDIIRPIFQTQNQYSKGIKISATYVWPIARGKYIAMCEGDDFWTDPYKLQKQVDFLETHPEFVIHHHNMKVIYEDIKRKSHLFNLNNKQQIYSIEELAHGNDICTASCVFRNGLVKEFPNCYNKIHNGVYLLYMLLAKHGKIKYSPEIMGIYRVHKNGVWEHKNIFYKFYKWVDQIDCMKDKFTPDINNILIEKQFLWQFEKYLKKNYNILSFWGFKKRNKYLFRFSKHVIGSYKKIKKIIHRLSNKIR